MKKLLTVIFIMSLPILLMTVISYFNQAYLVSEVPVNNLAELNEWIYKNIEYKSDDIKINDNLEISADHWQYPEETLELKTGDCEDMGILFVYLAKKLLNIDCKGIWLVSYNPGQGGHFVVINDNIILDPMINYITFSYYYCYIYRFVPNKVYTYKELLEEIEKRRNLIFY